MSSTHRPRLVAHDVAVEQDDEPSFCLISHRQGWSDGEVRLPRSLVVLLSLMDGRRTRDEICLEAFERAGVQVSVEILEEILLALDGIYLLESSRYRTRKHEMVRAFLDSPIRPPVCAGGVYPTDPQALIAAIDRLYTMKGAPGLPDASRRPDGSLRAVLAPHMDYRRGRHSFAWSYKEIAERSDATTFVIVATSHHSLHRFVLTGKDFATPLGRARCHRDFVNLVADDYGPSVFEDEIAHQPEHSIELEVVLLQHALRARSEVRIVPLLVGSFGDAVDDGRDPIELPDIAKMVGALRRAEETCGEKVCYIVSGDLAHLGPKFGDARKVDRKSSEECRARDMALLSRLAGAHQAELFDFIASEGDERRVCGFPPLYVGLAAAQPSRGKLLCYDQFLDPAGQELVTFASMSFD